MPRTQLLSEMADKYFVFVEDAEDVTDNTLQVHKLAWEKGVGFDKTKDNTTVAATFAEEFFGGDVKLARRAMCRLKDPKDIMYWKRNKFIVGHDPSLPAPSAYKHAGEAWTSKECNQLWQYKGKKLEQLAEKFGRSFESMYKQMIKLESDYAKGAWKPETEGSSSSSFSKSGSTKKRDLPSNIAANSFAHGKLYQQPGMMGAKSTIGSFRTSSVPSFTAGPQSRPQSKLSGGAPMEESKGSSFESLSDDDEEEEESDLIEVSESQARALKAIGSRKSVFYTGAAGTGKSFITGVLKKVLQRKGMQKKMAITAPTGVAACNVGGMTIHSWAGIGLGDKKVEQLSGAIMAKARSGDGDTPYTRWTKTDILVIDEISMLPGELFETLSEVGKRVRKNHTRPFGGLQLILCGDFFQLPPVNKSNTRYQFAFQTPTWAELLPGRDQSIVLDKVFRQKDGPLLRILNQMRRGVVTHETRSVLHGKVQQYQQYIGSLRNGTFKEDESKVQHTILFPVNKDVTNYNDSKLKQLPMDEQHVFNAIDTGHRQNMLKDIKAPPRLELRVGAQVMLVKNLDQTRGLINGARGVVKQFIDNLPEVEFTIVRNGEKPYQVTQLMERAEFDITVGDLVYASRKQLPLMLAWAITVHKSQGLTIRELDLTFSGMFEYGQGYVALSRAVDLEGLRLRVFDEKSVKCHPLVGSFYESMGYGGDNATETLTEDKDNIKLSLDKLADEFREELPSAGDFKRDAPWIQGTGGPPAAQASGHNFDDFDSEFGNATKGWANAGTGANGSSTGPSGNSAGSIGPFSTYTSLLAASMKTEDYQRSLDAPQPKPQVQSYTQPRAQQQQHHHQSSYSYVNPAAPMMEEQNAYNTNKRAPFKDDDTMDMDPGYLSGLKAQKTQFLQRPGGREALGQVSSFAVPTSFVAAQNKAPPQALSAEQKARIEANKQAALRRQQEKRVIMNMNQEAPDSVFGKPFPGV